MTDALVRMVQSVESLLWNIFIHADRFANLLGTLDSLANRCPIQDNSTFPRVH